MTGAEQRPVDVGSADYWNQLMAAIDEATAGATIARIETVRSALQPNVTHVIVTDSDGTTGLGETFYGASVVEAHCHDVIAPTLAAEKPVATPFEVARVLQGYVGYSGSGAEVRARSAIDIALWDIAAKRLGKPLRELLNPQSGSRIPTYNTCSGTLYVNQESRQSSSNWGIGSSGRPPGEFEDLWGFLNEPGRLAQDLVDQGFSGMKVWPFDLAAEASRGHRGADLSFGLSVLDAIRESVGHKIDLYLELHSLWEPDAAKDLIGRLGQYSLAWVEDPIRADRVVSLRKLRDEATMPIAVGENLGAGENGYPLMLDHQAVDVMILDLGWCGGITEAIPLQTRAHQLGIDVAYHDCTGPVSLAVATQVSLASENTSVQEIARAFWHGWYPQMATGVPQLSAGHLEVDDTPGHGVELSTEFLDRQDTSRRESTVE
jgi:L-alanine-DL-glutamate epimerase-like enolase superfamily enzyme